MSMTQIAGEYVEAPPVTPLPYGLFSAALVLDNLPEGAGIVGVGYQPEGCTVAHTTEAACWPEEGADPKTVDDGRSEVRSLPYAAYHLHSCRAPAGGWEGAAPLARRALELGEGRAAESIFASRVPVAPGAVDLTPVAGTAVALADGIALLEGYSSEEYAGVAVIHADRAVASVAASLAYVAADGPVLKSKLGTRFSAGAGYGGLGGPPADPDDPPVAAGAGEAWLWVTGTVVVRRAAQADVTPPILSKTGGAYTNDILVLAERPSVVSWECINAAVLVTATAEGQP